MMRLGMKSYNMILAEKQKKYKHYHHVKLINMNILQAKKYYLQIKSELNSKLSFRESFSKTYQNNWKSSEKEIKAIEEHAKQLAESKNALIRKW